MGDDTYATRRHLPHLAKRDRTYFVTFATRDRFVLPPPARQIALDCCIHDHGLTYWLHTAVVMPDHAHLLFVPMEEWTLDRILRRVKGVSARQINQHLQRSGPLWQDESFDRMLRSDEDVQKKGEYIANNPVRRGLAAAPAEYPWLWRGGR